MQRSPAFILILALLVVAASGCKESPPPNSVKVTGNAETATGNAPTSRADPANGLLFEATDKKPSYRVSFTQGDGDAFVLTLEPRGDYKVNVEYPLSYTLDDGAKKLGRDTFELSKASATLVFEGREAKALGGLLDFSVCDDSKGICDLNKVRVEPPGAPPPPTSL